MAEIYVLSYNDYLNMIDRLARTTVRFDYNGSTRANVYHMANGEKWEVYSKHGIVSYSASDKPIAKFIIRQ